MRAILPILRQWSVRPPLPHRYPPLARGKTLYVVGDIHGRLDCLRQAHAVIDLDRDKLHASGSAEIYLGDYVDRGPDSKGVIDCLLERCRSSRTIFLAGNHEIMMKAFLDRRLDFEDWRQFGGASTLLSYGVDLNALKSGMVGGHAAVLTRIPVEHRSFLDRLTGMHIHDDYCFVHAGVKPGCPAEAQSIDDFAWIRGEFLSYRGQFEHIVVHAHTPVDDVEFRSNRINLDTGAYRTGRLAVLRLDDAGPKVLAS